MRASRKPLLVPRSIGLGSRLGRPYSSMNGSGTTTTVASRRGIHSYGVDLNPALTLIARARSVPSGTAKRALHRIDKRLRSSPTEFANGIGITDPLLRWFGWKSVVALRAIEQHLTYVSETRNAAKVSDDDALVYLLFFRTLRQLGASLFSSNPTWVNQKRPDRHLGLSTSRIIHSLLDNGEAIRQHFLAQESEQGPRPILLNNSSMAMTGIPDASIEGIITSPPYGTRIDYAIAMSLELAFLAKSIPVDPAALREGLIGTTQPNALLKARRARGPLVAPCS